MGYVGVLSPTKAESRILGVPSPFVVSVTVSNPYLPESQTHQTKIFQQSLQHDLQQRQVFTC